MTLESTWLLSRAEDAGESASQCRGQHESSEEAVLDKQVDGIEFQARGIQISSCLHCTTKVAPADLMYSGHKFRTRLPIGVTPREHNFEELFQRDLEKKMQMKGYADNKRYVKPSDIQVGDSVLVRREAVNKTTPAYEAEPLQVQYKKGTRVVTERPDGSSITRTTAHFQKVPFRSMEEVHRWSSSEWPTELINELPPTIREDQPPGLEQADRSMTVNESIPAEAAPQLGCHHHLPGKRDQAEVRGTEKTLTLTICKGKVPRLSAIMLKLANCYQTRKDFRY